MSSNISGTYNNQYMVLDLKKVTINRSLDKGTLYIVEQIPTYVEYSDQTNVLRKGTFSSYSVRTVYQYMCAAFIYAVVIPCGRGKSKVLMENSQCHATAHHGGRVEAGS